MLPQQPAHHAGLIERSMPKEGTAMEAQMAVNATRNGLDMDLLQGIVGELREHPETATVTVRTRHRWDEGFAVDGYTEGFEQAGGGECPNLHLPHGLAVGSWRPRQRPGARRGDPWRAWRLCRHDLHHQGRDSGRGHRGTRGDHRGRRGFAWNLRPRRGPGWPCGGAGDHAGSLECRRRRTRGATTVGDADVSRVRLAGQSGPDPVVI